MGRIYRIDKISLTTILLILSKFRRE
jgi:hypothetical protein